MVMVVWCGGVVWCCGGDVVVMGVMFVVFVLINITSLSFNSYKAYKTTNLHPTLQNNSNPTEPLNLENTLKHS